MKKTLYFVLVCLLFMNLFSEYEHIIHYNSLINVNEDGSILVREKIRVYSEAVNIMHGIYRDFPTNYIDKKNNRYRVDFSIAGVEKNGEKEPYFTKSINDGVRIYIGSKDKYLDTGYYDYEIVYRTDRQIGFFKDFDELYWNVTGNNWLFDIDSVTCTIYLPNEADIQESKFAGYTGYRGESGNSYFVSVDTIENSITFASTRKLRVSEGITVAVGWSKGAVKEPNAGKRAYYILRDNADLLIGIIGLTAIFIFFLSMWRRVGKDPERGTVIPQFSPPENISPGDARYIKNMMFDNKIIVAEIVNLAVKKHLKIEKEKKNYVITSLPGEERLTKEEELIKTSVFKYGNRIVLDKKNYEEIGAMVKEIQNEMKKRSDGEMFKNNFKESGTGCFFSVLLIVLIFLISTVKPIFGLIFSCMFALLLFALRSLIGKLKQDASSMNRGKSGKTGFHIFGILLGIAALLFMSVILGYFLFFTPVDRVFYKPFLNIFFIALFFINIVFFDIMRAYTKKGMETLLKIEGFKMYINSADEGQSGLGRDISMNQDLFEKYLPYAIALDAESSWVKKFEDSFNVQDGSSRMHYYPVWYNAENFNMNSFASSFSSSMSSAISSSSQAPGSSSGSGGGGSSGGGGGGGGGGGW
ncbi:TPA: hypothetical protein DCW38_02325 [candidate division WOR-3 bacterium]|uniref:DUF2207 domain-containing protein n=1 Tax=candidate division WOR-3 bacterium TaxID=2052148 RepID=A0A350H8Y4_UNCW3|nr:hypothetical protein [candidate division WOR-3 bacterium]